MAGFSDNVSIWLSAIPVGTNALFTLVGVVLVDRWGRRWLLLISVGGSVLGLAILSVSFVLNDKYSSPTHPLVVGTCKYTSCATCVSNSQCGFCGIYDEQTDAFLNGTCAPTGYIEHSTVENATSICEPYSNLVEMFNETDYSNNLFYSYNACPDSKFS